MTSPTQTTDRRKRRTMLFPLSDDQLLPPDLPGLPEPVAAANERAHAARREYAERRAEAIELGKQAKAAPRFDELAAEAAIAAGEPPPKPTAAAKAQAAAEAGRVADAAEQVAKTATREVYDVMEDHHADYLEDRRAAYAEARDAITELVPMILARLPRLQTEEGLLRAATDWHNNPNSAALNLAGSADPAEVLQRRYDKALIAARTARPGSPVERQLVPVLAALAVLLEGEA